MSFAKLSANFIRLWKSKTEMKKRPSKLGRPTLCTPALTKKICKPLADGHTIAASCESLGVGLSTFHQWRQKYPDFADAVTRARAKARIKFVKEIKRLSADDWRGWAWLAERMFAGEFGRSEPRTIVIERSKEEQANENPLVILYDTKGQGIEKLTSFPQHPSMAMGYDAWKRAEEKRRLAEESDATEKAPAPEEIEDEEKISDAPPPKVLDKRLTGRIPDHWKGNGGK
jgi:transposase-like protein